MKKDESLIYGIMSNIRKYSQDAEIKRAKQEKIDVDNKKKEQSTLYTINLVLNNKPLILTYRIGEETIEIVLTDKRSGDILEYFVNDGKAIDVIKKHNFSREHIKKMLELPKS